MTEEEMYAFEEKHNLPHFPKEPPPPADPNNITREEMEASMDHIIACMDVMARQETILGDHEKAAVFKTLKDQLTMMEVMLLTASDGNVIDVAVWKAMKELGDKAHKQATRAAARDDD